MKSDGLMKTKSAKILKSAGIIELALAVGIISFWIVFFSTDVVTIKDPDLKEKYLAFESAFPLPDLYLSILLIIGGIGLLRKKFYGSLFSLLGGASLIFLGLLDVSFNTQNGIYLLGIGEAVMNGIMNLFCLGCGVFIVFTVWKSRIN